ncbi:MAG: SDR family NAD(P)-dependent oxidoreductase [Actinobacteria bacterium]|nr:SDR family NAD(P)-dependent oxidoreductase [Actinomycetota bacterium]MDA2997191.1 SDR family NAD(P)-dependent oxidoreductase [Actinomycetota bacterium]
MIVGATGSLGAQLASQLSQAGAVVSAVVRDASNLDATAVSQHAIADITDSVALSAALASLAPFDGVINAAGVVAFGNVADLDDVTLQKLFAINTIAPIVMLREGSRHITEGGFFANISAVVAQQPMAGMAAYSASKAGIWGAMTGAARELRRQQIDVIDIRPPHTETGLANRPIAGVAPKLPQGLEPAAVAARIVRAIIDGERDLPVEAFAV